MAIPLDEATLCVSCDSVTNAPDQPCPRCTSNAVLPLAKILNRAELSPAIPLGFARICVGCSGVRSGEGVCPFCGGRDLVALETILNANGPQ